MADVELLAGAAPGTPSSGYGRLYDHTSKRFQYIDDAGNIHDIAPVLATAIVSGSAGLNTTETNVVSATIPANVFRAGSVIRIRVHGTCTSTVANASNFRARVGTNGGATADNIAVTVTPTAAGSGTTIPFVVEITVTVRTAGAGGTMYGEGTLLNNGVTGVSAAAVVAATGSSQALDTTVANFVHLSYVAAAVTTTCTFQTASIEVLNQ